MPALSRFLSFSAMADRCNPHRQEKALRRLVSAYGGDTTHALIDLARTGEIAVAWLDRDWLTFYFRATYERDLTDQEWELLARHLSRYDDHVCHTCTHEEFTAHLATTLFGLPYKRFTTPPGAAPAADLLAALLTEAAEWAGSDEETQWATSLADLPPADALEALEASTCLPAHLIGPAAALLRFVDPATYQPTPNS